MGRVARVRVVPSAQMATVDVAKPMDVKNATEPSELDLYTEMKRLQSQLDFLDTQESYVKDETKNLRRELLRAKEEVTRIQSVPLVIGQFHEMVDQHHGIVASTTGSTYYVRILSTLNRELLNQMDGFDQTSNVKVIMATNRQDTLDPALLRPGRLDRKIEFPLPDRRQKRLVFQVLTQ